MVHANDQLVRAPSRAHHSSIPAQTFGEFLYGKEFKLDTSNQRRWGCKCYVLEHDHKGFNPKGTLGYVLNYSDAHESRCYDVLCPATNRVRKSLDVKFLRTPYSGDDTDPDSVPFQLDSIINAQGKAESSVCG